EPHACPVVWVGPGPASGGGCGTTITPVRRAWFPTQRRYAEHWRRSHTLRGRLRGIISGGLVAMSLVRRVSAAVLVAAISGWLSTLSPYDGMLQLTAAQSKASEVRSKASEERNEAPEEQSEAPESKPKPPPS